MKAGKGAAALTRAVADAAADPGAGPVALVVSGALLLLVRAEYAGRSRAPLVAVLKEDVASRSVEELGPPGKVVELAAGVELHGVEAIVHDGLDRAVHVRRDVLRPHPAPLRAAVAGSIPARFQAELVCRGSKLLEVRKFLRVNDGRAADRVEGAVHPGAARKSIDDRYNFRWVYSGWGQEAPFIDSLCKGSFA